MNTIIHHNQHLSNMRHQRVRKVLLDAETQSFRQAIEQQAYTEKPIAFIRFEDGDFHVGAYGSNPAMLELLANSITAILNEMTLDDTMLFFTGFIDYVNRYAAERYAEEHRPSSLILEESEPYAGDNSEESHDDCGFPDDNNDRHDNASSQRFVNLTDEFYELLECIAEKEDLSHEDNTV